MMIELSFKALSQGFSRSYCPMEICIDISDRIKEDEEVQHVELVDVASGNLVPCQFQIKNTRLTLAWTVRRMERNEETRYRVSIYEEKNNAKPKILLTQTKDKSVEVLDDGRLIGRYSYGKDVHKPYIYPVLGPEDKCVTSNAPGDHIHHHSTWVGLEFESPMADFWLEGKGSGRIVNQEIHRLIQGQVFADIEAKNAWIDIDGKTLLRETRSMRFWPLADGEWILDFKTTFRPSCKVIIADSKEAGTVCLRVAPSMEVRNGGRLENSLGMVNEAQLWGKRAPWIDYSGQVDGVPLGVSIFDNPENPRFPSHWHARDYGLLTANCFALSHFTFFRDLTKDGSMTIRPYWGKDFSYRLYVHKGNNAADAHVAEKYRDYVNPPLVRLQ